MPVLVLESASQLGTDGVPGISPPDGNHYMDQRTSDGPRQSHLSSLSALSTPSSPTQYTSSYMVTTQASSKAGALADTVTEQSTPFSNMSTLSSTQPFAYAALQPATFPAEITQPTNPLEASTVLKTSSSQPYRYLSTLEISSRMPQTHSQQRNYEISGTEGTPIAPPESSTTSALGKRPLRGPEQRPSSRTRWSSKFSRVIDSNPARFDSQLTSAADTNSPTSLAPKPRPYPPNLCPLPSTNRPHCLAKDRLHLWTPTTPFTRSASTSTPSATSDDALNRILEVIGVSWADSTKVLYGNALLVYHVYCDLNGPIPDHERCPISGTLLLAFLSSCAGGASGSTLSNYMTGIKAWHLLHGQSWNIHQDELRLTLQGAARLAPRNSKRTKRPPVTIDDLKIIRANLNMNDPGDAVVYACMVITFYCVARLGKFTVPNIREKFEPMKYISRRDVSMLKDKDGLPVIKFRIPVTKCDPSGEDVQCPPQPGCVTDPEAALQNHLRLNPAPPDAHLFAWKHPRSC
jgi:hypothetical protein